MAGHGALLDAVAEVCSRRSQKLERVDAIEIDSTVADQCSRRLAAWQDEGTVRRYAVRRASAFEAATIQSLEPTGYDLVITNPPYVRYQRLAPNRDSAGNADRGAIREALQASPVSRSSESLMPVWDTLVRSYSGLADLSLPSWLLAASLVRPGGTLALVVPNAWESRNYGDIVRYLMRRVFRLQYVISETAPGWFPSALVRTQLVVATRLTNKDAIVPLRIRRPGSQVHARVQISPAAGNAESIVGKAFPTDPDRRFASWLRSGVRHGEQLVGLQLRAAVTDGLSGIRPRRGSWIDEVEGAVQSANRPTLERTKTEVHAPAEVLRLLRRKIVPTQTLSALGLAVGQGLRTGCNQFFYVDLVGTHSDGLSEVRTSEFFDGETIQVPTDALRPVLRRQPEVAAYVNEERLTGRVLDLRSYVLPEDVPEVEHNSSRYALSGVKKPRVMPDALADFVRRAARSPYGPAGTMIPQLSAVKPNARVPRAGAQQGLPRFWYMLPDFARRHAPDAFVPRVISGTPTVTAVIDRGLLIDANFSTFWATNGEWEPRTIALILTSAWAQACMELSGTVLGGGALKLEATQLASLPLPVLSAAARAKLAKLVRPIRRASLTETRREANRIVLGTLLGESKSVARLDAVAAALDNLGDQHRLQRQPQ